MRFNGKLNQNIYVVHVHPFTRETGRGLGGVGPRYRERQSNVYSRILVRPSFLKVTLPSRGSKSQWKKLIKAILQSQSASRLVKPRRPPVERLCALKAISHPSPANQRVSGVGAARHSAPCADAHKHR